MYFFFELFNKFLYYFWFGNFFVRLFFLVCLSIDLWFEGCEFEFVRDIYIFFYFYVKFYKNIFYLYDKIYEFRFFFRIVILLCFENGLFLFILIC